MKFRKTAVVLKIIKYPLLLTGVLVASLLMATNLFMSDVKQVQISQNGHIINLVTTGNTVQDALDDAGIVMNKTDTISCSTTELLCNVSKIEIESPVNIYVNVRGEEHSISTFSDTLSEALSEAGITVTGSDVIEGGNLDSSVSDGMSVSINSFTEEYTQESFVLEHDEKYVADDSMLEGDYKTVVYGKDGLRTIFYRTMYENGEEISTEVIKDVTENPVTTVISYGTIKNFTNSEDVRIAYTKKYTMTATAYSPTKENHYYATSLYYSDGTNFKNREGGVAVDTSVIPLGTLLYIKGLNGLPDYGYAYACDTGKSIKGNKIDLFMESESDCVIWGVKNVEVYVLYDQSLSSKSKVETFLAMREEKLFVNGFIGEDGKIHKN